MLRPACTSAVHKADLSSSIDCHYLMLMTRLLVGSDPDLICLHRLLSSFCHHMAQTLLEISMKYSVIGDTLTSPDKKNWHSKLHCEMYRVGKNKMLAKAIITINKSRHQFCIKNICFDLSSEPSHPD